MTTAFLLYRSQTTLRAKSSACTEILHEARERNRELGVTGYLHLEDGHFYQWLEGPLVALEDVMARIERDPRHSDIEKLCRGTQRGRHFGRWEMGFGTSNRGTLFDWIAEHDVQVGNPGAFSSGLLAFMLSQQEKTTS
ncbi:BLUF domain-containing protein [Paracoccus ravus]|uniref:BLUF domain-containing protein n=1 Tax=Paracoccus ravus TaxID=2447760 RepID=UPI0014319B0C|nr:BLUF domain-containing protein [Paracoccus ravus]